MPKCKKNLLCIFQFIFKQCRINRGERQQTVIEFFKFVLAHVESVAVCAHAFLKRLGVYLFDDILKGFLDVFPSFIEIFHVQLQVRILHFSCRHALRLLCSQLCKMLLSQSFNYFHQIIVKIGQQFFLFTVVIFHSSGTSFLELIFQFEDISHEGSQFLVTLVSRICGQVWYYFLFLLSSNPIHSEALTCGLRGADSTVIHVFILYVNQVFCLFVPVVLVGAELFPVCLFLSLLGKHWGGCIASWRYHRFSSIGDAIW